MTPSRSTRRAVVLALLLGVASFNGACSVVAPAGAAKSPVPTRPSVPGGSLPLGLELEVARVVDGDTIVLEGGERVRLIGVDTPETKDPRKPVQCFGKEASAFLASILPKGTTVHLVGDVEQRDVYDRLLAYVYRLPDGMFVNAELVARGYAQVLTISPNVAHTDDFVRLARDAREGGRGLWGACGLA